MCAKPSRKGAKPSVPASGSTPAPTPAPASAASASTAAPASGPRGFTPWIDSTDPRRRTIAKLVLAGIWLYVAALWLLALDQTFDWGLFGPDISPKP